LLAGIRTMMFEIQAKDRMLRDLKKMPDMPPSEFSPFPWDRDRHHPFSTREIERMKSELRRLAPSAYFSIYPEEKPGGP
jgi:hypothetical protein